MIVCHNLEPRVFLGNDTYVKNDKGMVDTLPIDVVKSIYIIIHIFSTLLITFELVCGK